MLHTLPIYPAPAHPDSGKVLFLDNNIRLDKDTNVKLEIRHLIPLTFFNFSYCDYRTRQKYTLQSTSLEIVLSAIDFGRLAKYLVSIGDAPNLIGGSEKSTPQPLESLQAMNKPQRPLIESSHNVRAVSSSQPVNRTELLFLFFWAFTWFVLAFLSIFIYMAYWTARAMIAWLSFL